MLQEPRATTIPRDPGYTRWSRRIRAAAKVREPAKGQKAPAKAHKQAAKAKKTGENNEELATLGSYMFNAWGCWFTHPDGSREDYPRHELTCH